jgi:hypothetical protein
MTGKAADFGGIGNINLQQFLVLLLGTFTPRIAKALLHAGATYYIIQK